MKLARLKAVGIGWVYAGLGLAATLALVRFGLRLLAADELSPVGKWLTTGGGWVVIPFKIFFKNQNTLALPGSAFEPQALVAALVYGGLVLAVALVVAVYKVWKTRQPSEI